MPAETETAPETTTTDTTAAADVAAAPQTEAVDNFADGEPGADPKKAAPEIEYADPQHDEPEPEADAEKKPPKAGEKPGEEPPQLSPDEAMKSWDTVNPQYGEKLLEVAALFGIPAAEAFDYTPAQLTRHVQWAHAQRQATESPLQQQQQQQLPPGTTPPDQLPPGLAYKLDTEAMSEYVDANVMKAFQGMNEHYARIAHVQHQHLEAARQELRATIERVEYQEQSRIERWFDSRLAALGPEYTDLIGKGSVRNLASTSKELRNRVALHRAFQQFRSPGNGMPAVADDKAFDQALAVTFAGEQEKITKAKLGNALRERRQQSTARPSGRSEGKPRDPDERAAAYAEKRFQELGLST